MGRVWKWGHGGAQTCWKASCRCRNVSLPPGAGGRPAVWLHPQAAQPPGCGEHRARHLCPPRSGRKEEGEQGEGQRPPSLHWALQAALPVVCGAWGWASVGLRAASWLRPVGGSDCLKGGHTPSPPMVHLRDSTRRGAGQNPGPGQTPGAGHAAAWAHTAAAPCPPRPLPASPPRHCPPLVGGTRGQHTDLSGKLHVSGCGGLGGLWGRFGRSPPDAINRVSLALEAVIGLIFRREH